MTHVNHSAFAQSSTSSNSAKVEKVSQAVVKIYTTSSAADYFTPWSMLGSGQSGGSGSIIANQRILTNAHVIANASYIQVQRQGGSKKYRAFVEFVSNETDLAILTVEDDAFFENSKALKIGKLPETQTTVEAYGFPRGGKTLSITKGVLSRVEHQSYAHSNGFFLAGQIDAAINPGNSGGPIIVNGKIVGVVMQGNFGKASENQGYFIPPSIINHVLDDIKDNRYDGFLEMQVSVQSMENPALKAFHGMKAGQTGVLVTQVSEGGTSDGILEPGDVLLKVDDFSIADDKTIMFRDKQRTHFKYALDQHAYDDPAKFTFLRDGKEFSVEVSGKNKLKNPTLARDETFSQLPDYYIYGGIVFVPLNMNLIKRWGAEWRQKAPLDFLLFRSEPATTDRQEMVVALQVLPAEVNIGYHSWSSWIIDSINDKPIRNFQEFVQTLHSNQNPYVVIKDKTGYRMVLDHELALSSRDSILQAYRVPSYHSKGLLKNKE
ncbi:MAG: S1C family serine protease [Arenicella sp.]